MNATTGTVTSNKATLATSHLRGPANAERYWRNRSAWDPMLDSCGTRRFRQSALVLSKGARRGLCRDKGGAYDGSSTEASGRAVECEWVDSDLGNRVAE